MSIQNQPPSWAKKKGPPSLEELIAALLKKIKDSFEGGGSDNGPQRGEPQNPSPSLASVLPKVVTVIGILLLFNVVTGSFYTIEPGERGVILRFGKFLALTNPGLNFKIPLVDTLIKVDVETVRKQEFGFRTVTPGQKTVYEKSGYGAESLVLTGDKNVIDVEWIVQRHRELPVRYF